MTVSSGGMHDDFSLDEFDFLVVRHLVVKTLASFGLVAQTIVERGGDIGQSRRFQNRREVKCGSHGGEIMPDNSRQTSSVSPIRRKLPQSSRKTKNVAMCVTCCARFFARGLPL